MKEKIIEFFQNLPEDKFEQFNQAFAFYRDSPHKNPQIERMYNAQGYSDTTLEGLLYDLQKMHDVPDSERYALPAPVISEPTLPEVLSKEWFETVSDAELANYARTALTTPHEATPENPLSAPVLALCSKREFMSDKQIALVEKIDTRIRNAAAAGSVVVGAQIVDGQEEGIHGLESENQDLKDENESLQENNDALGAKVESLEQKLQEEGVALRTEFPFLNDKDCPDAFKILVADKISARNRYLTAHEKLLQINDGNAKADKTEIDELGKTAAEAFEENQNIYFELNAYKETGEILGKHKIFRKLALQKEVDGMTNDQLIKFKNSSVKYFSDNKTSLTKAQGDEAKTLVINARVELRKEKLDLVNAKLGVATK